ncbi:type-F conjugative transfer system mating-pair stabilization protein TraN [Legionella qingyii]|uniref:type-F conjugative transfer system mating-pair stabilization protein TraN n=1 Tax=Legionella qingyii TaxID=2184757 RepID=UPI000F8E5A66|nr:type-F conjugative transfer system mating-pair stabilization protein TraN [Legionella qingyii]RUR24248.1 type-F conjugative transfer system mating-pair stabilization protein TraN [Legionella qingyii]
MSKYGFILFCLVSIATQAQQNQSDALKARAEALKALEGFNPASVLNGYTPNPQESSLQPQEGNNPLSAQGLNAIKNNPTANYVYNQAENRSKVHSNPNSPEMRYAETLLENPDAVLEGACYREPANCKNQSVSKICEESMQFTGTSCKETLDVHVKPISLSFTRVVIPSRGQSVASFDVQSCIKGDWRCTSANTVHLLPSCEKVVVSVTRNNRAVLVTKQPDCIDSTVTVQLPKRGGASTSLHVALTEYVGEDQWKNGECERIKTGTPNRQCFLEAANSCVEPNQGKVIGGITIKRACWGRVFNYQCALVNSSSCTPLINQGCSQTSSLCTQTHANRCERFSQTFQCIEQWCMPEKTVCPEKIACSDGQCDSSNSETSDDMAEGLSRLGALAGAASDVAANQIHSGVPAIFIGKNSTCRKVVANARNCCRGSHRMTHCSGDEKLLAKAKEEGRAFKVGTYCAVKKLGMCLEKKESWCVFPTKLSSIIQIQGRYSQLGIGFGWAKDEDNNANCRGITPEELERINFSALDLSPIQQELISRMDLPNNRQINRSNQSHVERLKQEGRAHD